jgi:hypothetical protein
MAEAPLVSDPIKDTEKAIKDVGKAMEDILKIYNGRFASIPLNSPYWGMLNLVSKLQSQLAILTR